MSDTVPLSRFRVIVSDTVTVAREGVRVAEMSLDKDFVFFLRCVAVAADPERLSVTRVRVTVRVCVISFENVNVLVSRIVAVCQESLIEAVVVIVELTVRDCVRSFVPVRSRVIDVVVDGGGVR